METINTQRHVDFIYPVEKIVGPGAGNNSVNKEFMKTEWNSFIRPIGDPGLRAETNYSVIIECLIKFKLQMSDLETTEWFGVEENVAVPFLFVTSYIDGHIKGIFQRERD